MARTFALDINEQYTRLAQLELKNGKVELLSMGYDETTPTFFSNPTEKTISEQAKVMANLHTQLNIDTSKVSVVIPDSMTFSQLMVMPELKEEELVNSIRLQADEFVPLPIEDVYIDLEIVTKLANNKLLILFVAAPKKIVDQISTSLNEANLEALTLENELSAVGRFMAEVYRFIQEPALILNFGYGGSSIYFVNPPFPYFQITRTTRIGFDILLRDLTVNLNLKNQQAFEAMKTIGLRSGGSINIYPVIYPIINELLTEVEKTMLLAKERYNAVVKNIYTFNYDTYISGIHEAVQNKLNIPTQPLPISNILVPNQISQSFATNISSFVSVISGQIR